MTALAVGFIGGGPLGPALSRGLIDGGFDLIAFDADRSAELTSAMSGAYWCPSAREVAESADVVVTSTSAQRFRRGVPGRRRDPASEEVAAGHRDHSHAPFDEAGCPERLRREEISVSRRRGRWHTVHGGCQDGDDLCQRRP